MPIHGLVAVQMRVGSGGTIRHARCRQENGCCTCNKIIGMNIGELIGRAGEKVVDVLKFKLASNDKFMATGVSTYLFEKGFMSPCGKEFTKLKIQIKRGQVSFLSRVA